jgi:hypothetical protein
LHSHHQRRSVARICEKRGVSDPRQRGASDPRQRASAVVSTGANAAIPTEEHSRFAAALAAEEDFARERICEKRGVSDPRQRGEFDQPAGAWSG